MPTSPELRPRTVIPVGEIIHVDQNHRQYRVEGNTPHYYSIVVEPSPDAALSTANQPLGGRIQCNCWEHANGDPAAILRDLQQTGLVYGRALVESVGQPAQIYYVPLCLLASPDLVAAMGLDHDKWREQAYHHKNREEIIQEYTAEELRVRQRRR
jgi:hypothetical protein